MMILWCNTCNKQYDTTDEFDIHNEGVCPNEV
jgi:hypothetical protein